ncbi:MAG TPA: hypothetical protein VEO19_17570 [Terriglobia bacterium]|nr:hypothetical protein [Terriglobia bacterium]
MPSFYDLLKQSVLAAGVEEKTWASFIRALRSLEHGRITCWMGTTTPGRMVLRAWRLESRVKPSRVQQVARPLADTLKTDGPEPFARDLPRLNCFRAFEAVWGCPEAGDVVGDRLASGITVTRLCRYYFDMDSGLGLITEDDRRSIAVSLQRTNPAEQRKVLALFQRPLGKRKGFPDTCRSSPPPYPERFGMVWAVREHDLPPHLTPDDARNLLGLVGFHKSEDLVFFIYQLSGGTLPRVPTAVEAMGGWAYWPAKDLRKQTTMDYSKGTSGPREFVHSADIPPETMGVRWMGRLAREWDDA